MDTLEIAPETVEYFGRALAHFEPYDQVLLWGVATHALSLHGAQARRPSGETYGNHLLRVAARIVNDFGLLDKELLIAALYHDAVEDQLANLCGDETPSREKAYEILATHYGARVSKAVEGVTNPEELKGRQDRELRNQLYVAHVIEECTNNHDCFVIKLSDFFDNAMRMQYNLDPAAKARGARKYGPLFDYFVDYLLRREVKISHVRRAELIDMVVDQQEYVAGLEV